jgi:hypothetical protein
MSELRLRSTSVIPQLRFTDNVDFDADKKMERIGVIYNELTMFCSPIQSTTHEALSSATFEDADRRVR